jgi:hypothetical protein
MANRLSNMIDIIKTLREKPKNKEIEAKTMSKTNTKKCTTSFKAVVSTEDSEKLEGEVRDLAYFKWESAGRPVSDGKEFWLEAEEEIFGPKEGLLDA